MDFLDTIPREVRVKVYEHMDPEDVLIMRLVNKEVKAEIDEHITFSIRLDQLYRGYGRLCRLHVTHCRIVNLMQLHPRFVRQGCLFTYPQILKNLTLDGNVSQKVLLKILPHCTKIQKLSLTHQSLGIRDLLKDKDGQIVKCLQTSLTHLTHLQIQLLHIPFRDPFEADFNTDTLLSQTYPCLTSFKLYVPLYGNYVKLLQFLMRHTFTLTELDLQVGDCSDAQSTGMLLVFSGEVARSIAELRKSMDLHRLKALRLSKFTFRDDVLNLNQPVADILLEFLESQTTLRQITFHSPGELSIECLSRLVVNNEKRLEEVVVCNLKNGLIVRYNHQLHGPPPRGLPPPPIARLLMDMSMFNRCLNLKTLVLSSCTVLMNGIDVPTTRLTNLHLISPRIEKLHLTGLQLDLQEVITLSRSMTQLRELVIADAGVMKYSVLLGNLLRHCVTLTFLNVRPVVTRESGDAEWCNEVEEMTKLYQHFMGHHFDPLDDLDGFEAKISEADRLWILDNIQTSTPTQPLPCSSTSLRSSQ